MRIFNIRRAVCLTVLLACCGLASVSTATLTQISDAPDQFNEPNLLGNNPYPENLNPSVLETLYGETNLRRVDDSLDTAFRHTGDAATVKAVARFNNPSVEERLRFVIAATGTTRCITSFDRVPPNFGYPVGYTLPMSQNDPIRLTDSGLQFELGISGRVWSNPSRNTFGQDQLVTFEIIGTEGRLNNHIGNYVLAWEYFVNDDNDFQDVVFEISGAVPVPVPEPNALLLAFIGYALCVARYRKLRASGYLRCGQ